MSADLHHVVLHTTHGDITLELNAAKAPATVASFMEYARSGFYAGTIFHRVIDGFMVQGGGMDENMNQKKIPIRPRPMRPNPACTRPASMPAAH